MAGKKRFLDVWIVESNTVYREVPFEVVVDWVQQGRLLEDDMLRWSGQAEWFRLGGAAAFSAYLPRSEPFRSEDEAEALEPVQIDFTWRRREDDDDDEVDMIPLIDVSLVLLIFFMMISTGEAAWGVFANPASDHGTPGKREFWVGIRCDKTTGDPLKEDAYRIGKQDKELAKANTLEEFKQKLLTQLGEEKGSVEVTIMGDYDLQFDHEVRLMVVLESLPPEYKIKINSKKLGTIKKEGGP